MERSELGSVVREAGGRIVAALAARFRNLDIAEEALAEACVKAAETWPRDGHPRDPAAWLYVAARRSALDSIRRRQTRERLFPDEPPPAPTPEENMMDDGYIIPDERLRLIFVCCHPALSVDARVMLTLKVVCGLATADIARAFLISEPTAAQRIVRAKHKVGEAGVPFEIPGPELWRERLEAVLMTLEVAYSKAHEDAAGSGRYANYASEILALTRVLAELAPMEPEVNAFAALVRYAEARRPARRDVHGVMVPLSEQDPAAWDASLIREADQYFAKAVTRPAGRRTLQAAIHGAWRRRTSLDEPPPWDRILRLYDQLIALDDDLVARINRLVALAEVHGPRRALEEANALESEELRAFLPFQALRADILRRCGAIAEALAAYDAALALGPASAERAWLQRRRDQVAQVAGS